MKNTYYIITIDNIRYLKYNRGLVVDYIAFVAVNVYSDIDPEFMKNVVADSLKYFPNILNVDNKKDLSVHAYCTQIVRSAIAKYWQKSISDLI